MVAALIIILKNKKRLKMNQENLTKIENNGIKLIESSKQKIIAQISNYNTDVFSVFISIVKAMQESGAVSIELSTQGDMGLAGSRIGWKFFQAEVNYGKNGEKVILNDKTALITTLLRGGLNYDDRLQHFLEKETAIDSNYEDEKTRYVLNLNDAALNTLIDNYAKHNKSIFDFESEEAIKSKILSVMEKFKLEAGLSSSVDSLEAAKLKI